MIGAALIGEDGVRDVTTAPRNDAAAVAIGGKSWPLDIRLRPWVFRPRTDLLPMGFCCATLPVVTCALLQPKIVKLREEVARLGAIKAEMMKSEDKQISLTDPDARSIATSGKDTGIVGYNVQAAVDTKNHLIVAHEVTNVGTDRHQLSNIAEQARAEMGVERLDAVADRGYYASEEIRACEEAGITVTLPKPMTSNSKAAGRFGKPDFRYVAAEDAYVCPAGQRLAYSFSFTTEDRGWCYVATELMPVRVALSGTAAPPARKD